MPGALRNPYLIFVVASNRTNGVEAAMTIKLYAFTCGTVTGEFALLMEGGTGDITVPISVFLIEHAKGRALFDTGCIRIASMPRWATRRAARRTVPDRHSARRGGQCAARGDRPRSRRDRPHHQLAFSFRPCRRQRTDPQCDNARARKVHSTRRMQVSKIWPRGWESEHANCRGCSPAT
jgi:hypothetical protein